MTADQFAEDVAIVGRHGEIAAFKKLLFFEAGPFSVNLPALDGAPDDHHEAAMTVIGSTVAVFLDGAAEFGHRDENDIFLQGGSKFRRTSACRLIRGRHS